MPTRFEKRTIIVMKHTDWIDHITSGHSLREIARRAGLNNRTLSNQYNAGTLKAEVVIAIAEAYDESPIVALIDLGFIGEKWTSFIGTRSTLMHATDEELTDELLRRLHLLDTSPVDELANRRRVEMEGAPDDDDLSYLRGTGYAADKRVREPQEGDDDFGSGA